MTTHATGRFEVKSWDEKTYADLGNESKLTRASVTQSFHGDIEGEGSVEFLMMYPDASSAYFVGLQRVIGTLDGRTGTFVLQTNGTYAEGRASADWFVIPGSATGELTGLHGNGGFPPHPGRVVQFTLDYAFE